jgi:phospholipase C
MNLTRSMIALVVATLFSAVTVLAVPPKRFEHIIVIVQENRTPDNLFHGLCDPGAALCSTTDPAQYNIQKDSWKLSQDATLSPQGGSLIVPYDLPHLHPDFAYMCDYVGLDCQFDGGNFVCSSGCRMDNGANIGCSAGTNCPPNPQFWYVQSSYVPQYLQMAIQYGWANQMFQTNQGPSFPAHQFIFGGTSAPIDDDDLNEHDDSNAIFAADNVVNSANYGCAAATTVPTIADPTNTSPYYPGTENGTTPTCFERKTLTDLLESDSPPLCDPNNPPPCWKYYSTQAIWTAPNAIKHICCPSSGCPAGSTQCTGSEYTNHVVPPGDEHATKPGVLHDIQSCNLARVSWVIPPTNKSDHAQKDQGGHGPAWVASIVNAIGDSSCGYWNNTAIIVTWDDWGGWYDHVKPPIPAMTEKWADYQYGFRVPLLFISAYTPRSYIDNTPQDFGSILRFIEYNFNLTNGNKSGPGALGFADARGPNDVTDHLAGFYDLNANPRPFQDIPKTWPPCAGGQQWNLAVGDCECSVGSHWDAATNSCVTTPLKCPKGTYYDPFAGECLTCPADGTCS